MSRSFIWKLAWLQPVLDLFLLTHKVAKNLIHTLAWHHRSFIGMDLSANRVFTLLLHHLPPLPFISSSVLLYIIGIPPHRHWYSSSSLSSASLPPLAYPPAHLKNTLFVRCLQSEQNIHQKPHFSCAIVKFA